MRESGWRRVQRTGGGDQSPTKGLREEKALFSGQTLPPSHRAPPLNSHAAQKHRSSGIGIVRSWRHTVGTWKLGSAPWLAASAKRLRGQCGIEASARAAGRRGRRVGEGGVSARATVRTQRRRGTSADRPGQRGSARAAVRKPMAVVSTARSLRALCDRTGRGRSGRILNKLGYTGVPT